MHIINKVLDRNEPKLKCDETCKNFCFPLLDVACVLSSVYSVRKNEDCAIHSQIKIKSIT